ncbi:Uncharacterised protein [Streptococcus dysgalactiae subsp. equisimilis]|nr:Uncharacterised protein [Streptococcus dysgalactiae subsp. equisimilis]
MTVLRRLDHEVAGHAQLDVAALERQVGAAAHQGDVLLRRDQHVLLAGADLHALLGLQADIVLLRLQQHRPLVGDLAQFAALGEQADVAAGVDHHLLPGGHLLVLPGHAVDVLAGGQGQARRRRRGDPRRAAQGDRRLAADALPGFVVGAKAEVAHGLLEALLRRRIVPHALVRPGVVAQLASQFQRRFQHLHHHATLEMAGTGPELLLGAQQQAPGRTHRAMFVCAQFEALAARLAAFGPRMGQVAQVQRAGAVVAHQRRTDLRRGVVDAQLVGPAALVLLALDGAEDLVVRQRVGRPIGRPVGAPGDDRLVAVSVQVVDDHLLADSRDRHVPPVGARPVLRDADPAGAEFVRTALAIPGEPHLHSSPLVAMDLFPCRADHRGDLRTVDARPGQRLGTPFGVLGHQFGAQVVAHPQRCVGGLFLLAGILGAAMDHPHRPPPGVEVGARMTAQLERVARDQPRVVAADAGHPRVAPVPRRRFSLKGRPAALCL